jgi:septum formation protein
VSIERSKSDVPELVLASTSPYRRALLGRLGLPFRCASPRFDESVPSREGKSPREIAEMLAEGKAASIAALEPRATVIGCDQLASINEQVLGKPGSSPLAEEQLAILSARTHELITALVVIRSGRCVRHTDVTRLKMRSLTRAEIKRYVQRDLPLDCAGGYKLEEHGIVLFESIESNDQSAITGLPLIALTSCLRELGYEIP